MAWWIRFRCRCRFTWYVEVGLAPLAAEDFLLAWIVICTRGWVAMLWKELMRSEDEELDTNPLGVDQSKDLKTCNGQFAEAEVCYLDAITLVVAYNNASLTDKLPRPLSGLLPFLSRNHSRVTAPP